MNGLIRMDTQNLKFKVDPVWDAELRVWDAKNFGPVSPGTHRNKFVKKITDRSSLFLKQI